MKGQYKEGSVKCRDFTDGSKVCMSTRAWTIFFATVTKLAGHGGETKARSQTINETVFNETVSLVVDDMVSWILTRDEE